MNDTHIFDVLVVYNQNIASSASIEKNILPFPADSKRANYNDAYAYFLKYCENKNLKAAFTTTAEIIGPGKCKSYWLYQNKSWVKINNTCFAPFIFDKFSPISKKRIDDRVILLSNSVKPFNNDYLQSLFSDKHKTFEELINFSIPTVIIKKRNKAEINKALTTLNLLSSKHKFSGDFTSEYVLKDRRGSGGNNIFKLKTNNQILKMMLLHRMVSFVVQPFINFDKGYTYQNKKRLTDIRLIYMNNKLIQTYIRMAKPHDFRCNEHQGGTLVYTRVKDIPRNVLNYSKAVLKTLEQKSSLFALDFIVSNNGNVFLVEGNISPGIDWDLSKDKNTKKGKELIRFIVNEIANRKALSLTEKITTIKIPELIIPTIIPKQHLLINKALIQDKVI